MTTGQNYMNHRLDYIENINMKLCTILKILHLKKEAEFIQCSKITIATAKVIFQKQKIRVQLYTCKFIILE